MTRQEFALRVIDPAAPKPTARLVASKRRHKAGLSAQDVADWAYFARHVRVLPGRVPAVSEVSEPVSAPLPERPVPLRPSPRPHAALLRLDIGQAPSGLDAATWRRLQTGKIRQERSLDLHGHSAQRAHAALSAWLHAASAMHLRCVEVITGRGAGQEGGVIRRELPHWLNQPDLRPLILAAAYPSTHNTGSVKLLLRKTRSGR